jgi:CPA1 family monovalent cation:H+ antiporter
LPARVQGLIQAESLFNDASSLVQVWVAAAATTVSWIRGFGQFALLAGGGWWPA